MAKSSAAGSARTTWPCSRAASASTVSRPSPSPGISISDATGPSPTPASAWVSNAVSPAYADSTICARRSPFRACSSGSGLDPPPTPDYEPWAHESVGGYGRSLSSRRRRVRFRRRGAGRRRVQQALARRRAHVEHGRARLPPPARRIATEPRRRHPAAARSHRRPLRRARRAQGRRHRPRAGSEGATRRGEGALRGELEPQADDREPQGRRAERQLERLRLPHLLRLLYRRDAAPALRDLPAHDSTLGGPPVRSAASVTAPRTAPSALAPTSRRS